MEVGKVIKPGEDLFFFFFFFPLFIFENDGNLFWVYQNGNFLPGKSISRREKKSGKITLPLQENMPVTPLGLSCQYTHSISFSSKSEHDTVADQATLRTP